MNANFSNQTHSINYEYYKVFYNVAHYESITLAAEALYITQPAVSKSIHNLEQELGCTLFLRTQKGMILTEEGKALFSSIKKAVAHIESGEHKISQMLNMESGNIRIGASELTLHFFLLPHLEKFHSIYPSIKMNISNSTTPETVQALKDGQIDFGIISSSVDSYDNFEVTPLCDVQDTFIVGEQFKEMSEREWTLEELTDQPLICLDSDSNTRHFLDDYFLANGVILNPDIELATMDLIVPFTEKNLGVGITIRNFAEQALKKKKVYELKVDPPIRPRQICLIQNKKIPMSLAGQQFLGYLEQYITKVKKEPGTNE